MGNIPFDSNVFQAISPGGVIAVLFQKEKK